MDWTVCEYGNEPSDSINEGNLLTRCVALSFSRTLLHGVRLVWFGLVGWLVG
jgi:hypothetical protein